MQSCDINSYSTKTLFQMTWNTMRINKPGEFNICVYKRSADHIVHSYQSFVSKIW